VKIAQKDETARRLMSIFGFGRSPLRRQAEARAQFENVQSLFAANCLSWARPLCCFTARGTRCECGAKKLIDKQRCELVAGALANKMARIAFAILRGKAVYRC